MEPKRQRAIWIGAGLFFVVAVGSGFIPDLMLSREMAAAREEGLVQPIAKETVIPNSQNAYVRYNQIGKRYAQVIARLRFLPKTSPNDPQVARMLKAYVEASSYPSYREPKQAPENVGMYRFVSMNGVRSNASFVAKILAGQGASATDLTAAARMANHLRQVDPAEVPSSDWAGIAERALNRAATLKLTPDERKAVVAALGPVPDLKDMLRKHVVRGLQSLENPKAVKSSARMAREKMRFLKFWREFLRTVPSEPKALATAVAAAETKIAQADEGVGIYRDYGSSSATPWKDWAETTVRVTERLNADGGGAKPVPRP